MREVGGLVPVTDLGSLSCALSSSLNPRLPSAVTRCRRSEGDQGSGFVPLRDTVTNTVQREEQLCKALGLMLSSGTKNVGQPVLFSHSLDNVALTS